MAVRLAELIARQIHESYLRYADAYDMELNEWSDLKEHERQLAVAVIADVLGKGLITAGPELEDVDARPN
jgi:hypothetical protein